MLGVPPWMLWVTLFVSIGLVSFVAGLTGH